MFSLKTFFCFLTAVGWVYVTPIALAASGKASSPMKSNPLSVFTSSDSLNLAFVGDIMMGGSAAHKLKTDGPNSFFTHVSPLLKQADLVTGNLECPLGTKGAKFPNKKYTFLVDPSSARGLAHAGFNLLTLANNHTMDFGVEALKSTFSSLESNGLKHAGAGLNAAQARRPAWFDVKGRRVAVLAYSITYPTEYWATENRPGCAVASGPEMKRDISGARAKGADLVVVCVHWGQEKKTQLRGYQPALAHLAVDAGADAVIGHHPHIWQGLEVYHGKPIAYSLGNFCFGSLSSSTTESGILYLSFDRDNQWAGGKIVPLNVNNYQVRFCPAPMKTDKARNFFRYLSKLSSKASLSQGNDLIITWNVPVHVTGALSRREESTHEDPPLVDESWKPNSGGTKDSKTKSFSSGSLPGL